MIKRFKYPRTFHLPNSLGPTSDDKILAGTSNFKGKEVIVTEKLDGGNITLYRDGLHARSIDSNSHPSQDWIRNDWAKKSWMLEAGHRIVGENMYAVHSIKYDNLDSFFYGINYWIDDVCLDWDKTIEKFDKFDYPNVPILWRGVWDETIISNIVDDVTRQRDTVEGFVVRVVDKFHYDEFGNNVAKFVRYNHVQTDTHWSRGPLNKNKLQFSSNTD